MSERKENLLLRFIVILSLMFENVNSRYNFYFSWQLFINHSRNVWESLLEDNSMKPGKMMVYESRRSLWTMLSSKIKLENRLFGYWKIIFFLNERGIVYITPFKQVIPIVIPNVFYKGVRDVLEIQLNL